MMWKTLILFAVTSVVLAGKIKRHHANYEFHIKHDYDYHKHHEKLEDIEEKAEQQAEQEHEPEHNEEKKEEEHQEEKKDESEPQNGGDVANDDSGEPEHEEKYKHPGYEFMYKVKDHHTHDIKGQHEKKYGDEVKGVYWLLQPDGHKRTVDYHADKHSGFHANVKFSKSEEPENEQDVSKPTSEFYLTTYHGIKDYIPVKEEQEEEQDKQEESAHNIPIYVI